MKFGEWLTHSGKQSLWQYTIHTPASTVSFHLLLQVCGPQLDPWDLWPAISDLTSLSLGKEGSGKLPELFHMLTTLECSAVITVPSRRFMQCIWGNGDYSQYWTHSRAVNLLILHPQLAVRYPTVQRENRRQRTARWRHGWTKHRCMLLNQLFHRTRQANSVLHINLPRNPSTSTTHVRGTWRDQRQNIHHGHLYNTQFEAVFNPLCSLDLGTSFEYFRLNSSYFYSYMKRTGFTHHHWQKVRSFSPSEPIPLILQKQEVLRQHNPHQACWLFWALRDPAPIRTPSS